MQPKIIKSPTGPEEVIIQEIIAFLTRRSWLVLRTHGNMYQSGFPDLWVSHVKYGSRWVEVKNPKSYAFTPAQLETFPKICANGSSVWVLTGGNETEYLKLFKHCNWHHYLKF